MPPSRTSRFLKSPRPPVSFTPGPPIQPYEQLLQWLQTVGQSENARRLLKLPVCIQYSLPDRLGIGHAHIGTTLEDLEQGAILLTLDDSALGLSLFSVFQSRCPQDADHCAFWLEGYWGPLLPLPLMANPINDPIDDPINEPGESINEPGESMNEPGESMNEPIDRSRPSSQNERFPFAILHIGDTVCPQGTQPMDDNPQSPDLLKAFIS